jgi:Glycosyltransferases involved in cell wall biogenesis
MYSDITLVIPAKNESESLPSVLEELKKFKIKKHIILEKRDKKTIKSIKNFNCKIILQKNKGYGDALIQGIKSVRTRYFCIFNADGSFNPLEIKIMLNKLKKTKSDFVFGTRYEKDCGSEDDTLVTLIGNFMFTNLGKIFFNLNITDILYTYVLGKTKEALLLNLKSKDFKFCIELPIKAKRSGFRLVNSKSYERSRIGGKKKVNAIRDGFLILSGMINLFFS